MEINRGLRNCCLLGTNCCAEKVVAKNVCSPYYLRGIGFESWEMIQTLTDYLDKLWFYCYNVSLFRVCSPARRASIENWAPVSTTRVECSLFFLSFFASPIRANGLIAPPPHCGLSLARLHSPHPWRHNSFPVLPLCRTSALETYAE
jgi:hypothetical protein